VPKVDDILTMIRRQLRVKLTDQDAIRKFVPLQSATAIGLAADERLLGFNIPPLLKQSYIEIGNGGFGPGYGLIGMTSGAPDDTGKTAPEIYYQLRSGHPTDPAWKWPECLLPICHWGCAIYSCIACDKPDFPIRIFDPNVHDHRVTWSDAFFEEATSFDAWISAWADGVDLWEKSYGVDGAIAIILAQREKLI